jgi:branched-chain amino acid transport system substrate-binding protein
MDLTEKSNQSQGRMEAMRKSWFSLAITIIILAALTVNAGAAEQAKFAIFEPLSGAYAAYAEEHKRGALMALEEINNTGGVLGQPAKLFVRDDELNTGVALRRIKELDDSEKLTVIGGTLSGGMALGINEWACKNNKIYMSFCDSRMGIGNSYCENGFSVGVSGYIQGEAIGRYMLTNVGKSWVIIVADYGWGHEVLQGWLNASQKYDGKFLEAIYVPLGTKDISAYLPKIISQKPDILVFATYGSDLTAGIKQCMEMGVTKKTKIVATKTDLPLIKEVGSTYDDSVYGTMTFYWKHVAQYPKAQKFVENYMKLYNKPPLQDTDRGYSGTLAVFEAMRRAGTVSDIAKIRKELEDYVFLGNKGAEVIRACDHNRTQSVLIVRGKGAKAEGWDMVDVVDEMPFWEVMQTCENNRADIPYGKIALPGK